MHKKIKTKIITIVLLILLLLPGQSSAEINTSTHGAGALLGTNLALGSPLLDTSFSAEDWNKWELIVFGVFLSNFVYPLVDDYESAFTINNHGSKGSGLRALKFASGDDSAVNAVVEDMLEYVIANQGSALQRLYVKKGTSSDDTSTSDHADNSTDNTEDTDIDSGTEISGLEQATFKDLFLYTQLKGGGLTKFIERNFASSGDYGNISGYWSVGGPRRFIGGDIVLPLQGGTYEVIFSYSDGWDVQMMGAWLLRVSSGKMASKAFENFKKLIENDAALYLDTFGNIVAVMEGDPRLYMVYPAASNQHITQNPQYNLLTSVMLNGSYLNTSGTDIVRHSLSEHTETGRGGALSGTDGFEVGKLIVLFDSHALVMQELKRRGVVKERGFDSLTDIPQELLRGVTSRFTGSSISDLKLNEIIDTIFKSEISVNGATAPFRIEVIKAGEIPGLPAELKYLAEFLSDLSAIYTIDQHVPVLTYINTPNGKEVIFSNPVVTSVTTDSKVLKQYLHYLYNVLYKMNVHIASRNNNDVINTYRVKLGEISTLEELGKWAIAAEVGEGMSYDKDVSIFFKDFINKLPKTKETMSLEEEYSLSELVLKHNLDIDVPSDLNDCFKRIIKAYPESINLQIASNVLGVKDGTNFELYSSFIYATYLDWYGVRPDGSHKFNTKIFSNHSDILQYDIEEVSKGAFLTEEEKRREVLDYTHLMLDPVKGREYRAGMVMDSITDWIYKTYRSIVYGGLTQYSPGGFKSLATIHTDGFLHVKSYNENFMTKWFIEKYIEYIVVILGISVLLLILVGILNRKKLIWYLVSLFLITNVFILVPAVGDMTPYVVENVIQNAFKDKMSYWVMSEAIYNNEIEQNISGQVLRAHKKSTNTSGELFSQPDGKKIANLVRMLNIQYLDRALMLKLDISKKVNETQLENFEEIQKLQSARWLLPMVMRQFTASDKSANYIFVPIGDEYVNLSNLYSYYVPSDLTNPRLRSTDGTAQMPNTEISGAQIYSGLEKQSRLYEDYTLTSFSANESKGMNELVILGEDYKTAPGWQSGSRVKDDNQVVHTSSYFLSNIFIPGRGTLSPDGRNIWKQYIETYKEDESLKGEFFKKASELELKAGAYNSFDITTVDVDYGYLWATQNPLHYFYQVIRDTFRPDANVAVIAGELQGIYKVSNLTGKEERHTFMHFKDTGKIRDFLDLEELFTNVIPYLYQVQILAGGFDGKSGLLGDAKIENYLLYENNYKSWLFRSNWATKLMESSLLTRSAVVRDAQGKEYVIENPVLPSCYPQERPMVFSEAQMYAMGLNKSDLNVVELKIIKVLENVERRWTLLLNYVNLPGVVPDVIYKQMALDAVLEFNREFSTGGTLNPAWNLYPTGIDLRSLSFDAIMKMLMLNNTKDFRYIYGDTMKRVIENSDIISGILLLTAAFICAFIIPFIRDVALGLIFYLGFWAILSNILSAGRTKYKILLAFVINNILFLIMTIIYFLVFAAMINITYSDNVLNVNEVAISVGSPVWVFFIILIISILYMWGILKLIKTTILNYNDLGFEIYAAWSNLLLSKLQGTLRGAAGSLRDMLRGGTSGIGKENSTNHENNKENNNKVKVEFDTNTKKTKTPNEKKTDTSAKTFEEADDDVRISIDIDKEIKKGKQ